MKSTSKLTQPIKWVGGKSYLASSFVALMPKHRHYVEPFAGGLAVLLERDPNDKRLWWADGADQGGVSEVVNDLNVELINFWRVLRDPDLFKSFAKIANAIPLSRKEFEDACTARLHHVLLPNDKPYVPAAVDFFVCARQSRAGTFKGFTSLTRSRTRRGINGNASEWLGAVEGLPAVHARLLPVVIENMDAVKLIRREDGPGTLHYCDPTYVHETRTTTDAYEHEMTVEQHQELLTTLVRCEGKVMLSGYRCELYDSFLGSWKRHEFEIANHAAGGKVKRRMIECLWCNFS